NPRSSPRPAHRLPNRIPTVEQDRTRRLRDSQRRRKRTLPPLLRADKLPTAKPELPVLLQAVEPEDETQLLVRQEKRITLPVPIRNHTRRLDEVRHHIPKSGEL